MSLARFSSLLILIAFLPGAVLAADPGGQISIVGSSTVFPFTTTVAEHFAHEGHKAPVVESTGTGGGFKIFCAGVGIDTPDINDASRPMTAGEKKVCAQNGTPAVDELRVGYDGIILAGTVRSKSFNVTLGQLWRATAKMVPVNGKWVANPYGKWRDIDPSLPDKPIELYGPAPNHGTRDAFVELVMEPSCDKAPESRSLAGDEKKRLCSQVREDGRWTDVSEDYAVILGKLSGRPEAMAIFTFSYLDQNPDKIRAATVDGVKPSLETISSGQYPVSRPLFIYVKHAHLGAVAGLADFVKEYLSNRAAGPDGYLADKGLIPMPQKELQTQQAVARKLAAASVTQ